MLPATHRCPDCGRLCGTAAELADHALYVHIDTPTPAAHIRPQRFGGLASKVAVGIAILAGVGFWALAFLSGGFDSPDTAPLQPGSVVHQVAIELKNSGEVDEYRSVEPEDGWDVEYEFDDGDGYIRVRNEAVPGGRETEIETLFDDDLFEAMQAALRRHGIVVED